jgi:hypothetical protein
MKIHRCVIVRAGLLAGWLGSTSSASPVATEPPPADFKHPESVLFAAEDRSIYEDTHPVAWGVRFRVAGRGMFHRFRAATSSPRNAKAFRYILIP